MANRRGGPRPREGADPLAGLAIRIEALTGRPASAEQRQHFQRYLDLLLLWNQTHRLTGGRSSEAIARDLFEDSVLFLALLPSGPLAMVDIGAGVGIPGVPLRILRPDISVTLIESRRKPVSFLATLKRELMLSDIVILEGRAEDLVGQTQELEARFQVVVSRGVGPHLLPTALRYLEPGGLFIASGPPPGKRPPPAEPTSQSRWEEVSFPDLDLVRTFLLARKPT